MEKNLDKVQKTFKNIRHAFKNENPKIISKKKRKFETLSQAIFLRLYHRIFPEIFDMTNIYKHILSEA